MYNDVLTFIQNLSEQICKMFNVPIPKVYIVITDDEKFSGEMSSTQRTSAMYVKIFIPHSVNLKKHKTILTVITIHEHCHYINDYNMSIKERIESSNAYIKDPNALKIDEIRTWQHTKKVAKDLGFWTKELFKEIKQFKFSSRLTF